MRQLLKHSLFIETQSEAAEMCPDNRQGLLELLAALIYKYEVIHVSDIVLDPKLLFDNVVHLIEIHQGYELAHLTAEAYSCFTGEAVDNIIEHLLEMLVCDALCDLLLRYAVIYAFKEVMHVALEIVALVALADAVVSAQMLLQSLKGVVCPSAFLASTVISYERSCNSVIYCGIAEASLHLPVADPCSSDVPLLGFIDFKLLVRQQLILAALNSVSDLCGVLQSIELVLCDRGFPPYVSTAFLQASVHLPEFKIILFFHISLLKIKCRLFIADYLF